MDHQKTQRQALALGVRLQELQHRLFLTTRRVSVDRWTIKLQAQGVRFQAMFKALAVPVIVQRAL